MVKQSSGKLSTAHAQTSVWSLLTQQQQNSGNNYDDKHYIDTAWSYNYVITDSFDVFVRIITSKIYEYSKQLIL